MSESSHIAEPDFLARMVDKALGTNIGVDPRLPSLFEPPQGAMLHSGAGWQQDETERTADGEGDDASSVPATPSMTRWRVLPLQDEADETDHPASTRDAWPPAPAFVAARKLPPVMRIDRDASADPLAGPVYGTRRPAPLSDRDMGAAELPPAASRERPPVVPSVAARRELTAQAGEREQGRTRDAASARAGAVASDSGAIRAPVLFAPSTVVSQRPRRAEMRGETASVQPVPVVNITIGRIEVRAVQDPGTGTKPRTGKPGPQPMSLDEYLKQRGGGR